MTATPTALPLTAPVWTAPIHEYTLVDANNPGVMFRWEPVAGATGYWVYMQICEPPTPTNDCPAFAETGFGPITATEWSYTPPPRAAGVISDALPDEAQMRVFYVLPVGADSGDRGPRSGSRYVIYQPGLFASPTPREFEPTLPPHPTSTATATPIAMERVTNTPTFTPTSASTEDPASSITDGDLLLQLGLGVSTLSFELAWPPDPVNYVNIRAVVGDAAVAEPGIIYELRLECALASGDNVQWAVFGAPGPSPRSCGDVIPLAFGPNRSYWEMQVLLDRLEGPVTKTLRLVAAPVDVVAPMLPPLDLTLSYDRPVSASGMVSFPQGMRDTEVNLLLPSRDLLPVPARFEVTVTCAGRTEPLRWNILNTIDIHQPPGFDSGPHMCGVTVPFAYSQPETVPYISVWYDWPAAQSSANFTVTVRHVRPAPSATPSLTPEPERPSETPPSETARPTDIPIAAPDRDFAIRVNAAEGARFSDDISYPGGDTSDLITVTLDPLPQRGETFMQFTLECTGVGVEVLRWQVRGITSELSCGALARVPFSASASQQTVVVTFERSAQQSYVAYTLSITPP